MQCGKNGCKIHRQYKNPKGPETSEFQTSSGNTSFIISHKKRNDKRYVYLL